MPRAGKLIRGTAEEMTSLSIDWTEVTFSKIPSKSKILMRITNANILKGQDSSISE